MIQANTVIPLLQIFDMPSSIAFYRDKLGFEVVQTGGEDWAMLRLGGALIMLNTRYEADERPPAPDPAAVVAHSDTVLFFHCPNVDETYQYLVSKGVEATPPTVTWYGMRQVNLKDPDGYPLCFQYEAEHTESAREATSTA